MNSRVNLAVVALLFLAMSLNSKVMMEQYVWNDGSTVPIECAKRCLESGIKYSEQGTERRFSDDCKETCFGKQAIIITNSPGSGRQNIQNEVQKTETIRSANSEERDVNVRVNISEESEGENRRAEANTQMTERENENIRIAIEQKDAFKWQEVAEAGRIGIGNNKINISGQEISANSKSITARISKNEVVVAQESGLVLITDEKGAVAHAEQVEIFEGRLIVDGLQVMITPTEIIKSVKGELHQLRIERTGAGLAYIANATRRAKLFGVFDVEYEMTSDYSAEDGRLLGSNKPFWSIFAFE